jgi:hypothetical protein
MAIRPPVDAGEYMEVIKQRRIVQSPVAHRHSTFHMKLTPAHAAPQAGSQGMQERVFASLIYTLAKARAPA